MSAFHRLCHNRSVLTPSVDPSFSAGLAVAKSVSISHRVFELANLLKKRAAPRGVKTDRL